MRIPELKPQSADFKSEQDTKPSAKHCDVPSCPQEGAHRAPKTRALDEYYHFCVDHVREYNNNWNYFEGMSQQDVEQHMYNTMTWDRPTWASTLAGLNADNLKSRIYEGLRMDGLNMGGGFSAEDDQTASFESVLPKPELDALATLNLEPPVTWDDIRTRYKKLVKKHHPDISGDHDGEAIKQINLAYSILKIAYSKFEKLEKA
tara:strand:+ start:70 stop:681 length:612 start_codon:yes stop_codon:yes gene_type:complete